MKLFIAVIILCTLSACANDNLAQQRYWQWYDSLTPEQQAREDQRKHERELAAMQALGQVNFGRGPLGEGYTWGRTRHYDTAVPTYQPRPYAPPMQCVSRSIGGQVYTDCQ